MQSVDDRLRHVTLKVQRAKEHVAELERELKAFLDSKPYRVGAKREPQSRKPVSYVESVQPTPERLPLIAGDIIQNLMGALDHLAYQIVCSDTGDQPPNPAWIYFPIADDATKYEAKKRGKMEGARQETFDAIDALKPYKGGNDPLWVLYRLNNIEKHRLLLTVGSQADGIHLGQLMARDLTPDFPDWAADAMRSIDKYLMPADTGFPLKAGFELYVGATGAELDPNQEFRFTVAINEPEICEGKRLLNTISESTALVEGIVTALSTRLT